MQYFAHHTELHTASTRIIISTIIILGISLLVLVIVKKGERE